jgi:hypothetical protein
LSVFVIANIVLIESVSSDKAIGSEKLTIAAIADAFVNQSSPDTNYGNDNQLKIKCNNYTEQAYIMFDLSVLPANAIIIEANMQLTITDIEGYGSWGVTIGTHFCSDNSWSETGITWNNKPDFESAATDTNGYWMVWLPKTDSWNVTVDVKAAFALDKKLTEVIIFEESETEWGYADFRSRGTAGVELAIEYSTKPIYSVQLQSIHETGTTLNLGTIDFSTNTYALPNNLLVVEGNYEVSYEGGYTFVKWETEGEIAVSNPNSQKTTVSVTGNGKLRAVGNAEVMQYFYDDATKDGYTFESAGEMAAVRFTPIYPGDLKKARFYIDKISGGNTFKVHVMDENLIDIITPFSQTAWSTGWLEVDLSPYDIYVQDDFGIAVEWIDDYYPCLGIDTTDGDERSFLWNGTEWKVQSYRDYMIRAVVETDWTALETEETYWVNVGSESFAVKISCDSILSGFTFSTSEKMINFQLEGLSGTAGYCNVSFPTKLLEGPYTILVNDSSPTYLSETSNGETSLYFTFNFESACDVEIVGSSVIPEFASWFIIAVFMLTTLIAVLVYRMKTLCT